ncbi:MAG: hypothetical protein JSV61_04610 [Anaerolineales bacterium]|nr:MAG: hypothetical protein JSV61_04610 [Anaerolineales bacterium]
MLRWLGRNLSTLLIAFLLALFVWVAAVISTDPNIEQVYARSVDIEIIGQDPSLLLVRNIPSQVQLTLNAPQSLWSQLESNPELVTAWIDLSGLGEGEHVVKVKTQIALSPLNVVNLEPAEISLSLEPALTQTHEVELRINGDPALGYRRGPATIEPAQINVSGRESLVQQVVAVRAFLDIAGANDTVRRLASVIPIDEVGETVGGVTLTPASVSVTLPINLQGGYRNVVVKVVTNGQVDEGYWLTNVSISPPNVTVFSSNPQLVNALPGFVETNPIDLTGLSDDVDIRATLDLPEGVSLAGEESVLVRLSIAALEGSLPISLPIEVVGLTPELEAIVSPETVDILLTGPLPILNNLNPAGIRVSVNVTGLEIGVHQLAPVVDLLPSQVEVASILTPNVEVTIRVAPTPTPTLEPTTTAVP